MRFDKFYTKPFCRPVLPESGSRFAFEMALLSFMQGGSMEQAGAHFQARKIDGDLSQKCADKILEVRGDTALIHIDGAIDKNLSQLDRLCTDSTDLADVDTALDAVANDRTIKNVMLIFDSPGGGVTGVPETAARIAALAEQKNVFAYCEGMCCSAAYWLASQCDQIFSTGSAQMGSIGVYLALLDQSRRLDDMRLTIKTIKDGDLKAAGAPWKPLTDDEEDHFPRISSHSQPPLP